MDGVIERSPLIYQARVFVTPIRYEYGSLSSPYTKYLCPVCDEIGFPDAEIGYIVDKCPICGVNISWENI